MPGDAAQDVDAPAPDSASPLAELLKADDDAEWTAWGRTPIVSNFAEPQAEYAAVRKACGLMHRPERGLIRAAGPDAASFLNNLLTNALVNKETKRPIPPGHGCYSFLLNLKGRIVADLFVLRPPGTDDLLLAVDRAAAPMLVEAIDRYRFSEKVKFTDESAAFETLELHGPGAVDLLNDAADGPVGFGPTPADFPATSDVPTTTLRLGGVEVVAYRDDPCGVPGVTLLVPRDAAVAVWQDLTTRFGQTADDREYGPRRLRPVGWAMFNACRIENGRPLLGVDFTASPPSRPGPKKDAGDEPKGGTLPAETGPLFDRGVSVTGGCYLGQEVVARMHARRVTAKQIVGVRMLDDALPAAGAPVEVDDAAVGTVTSSTISPVLSNACLCLATVKRPHFEAGTRVVVPAEGRHAAGEVVGLPFLT